MRSSKTRRKTLSVASVETKCCQYPPLQFLWTKTRSTWPDNDRHFWRKIAQLCRWTKIHTKQWIVLGALAFQCMRASFLCAKCDNFAWLQLHLKRWFFFAKIGIFCKSIAGPLSEAKTNDKRIKLIICQIRHMLSATIYEISTSWKKNVRWRNQYYHKKKYLSINKKFFNFHC